MKPFKIIISPAKTFNLNAKSYKKGILPFNENITNTIMNELKSLSLEETKKIFKLSDKKATETFSIHKHYGEKFYKAIELYNGLAFKQLDLKNIDQKWMNKHVVIIDALYGVIKPFDLISPYRLDFNIKLSVNLKAAWKEEINNYFKDYDVYNLTSKEFSSLIEKKLINVELEKGQIKKARGLALQKILENRKI